MQSKIAIPLAASRLGGMFEKRGVSLYMVGGYVRNALIGIPGSDFDVCSAATPDLVDKICREEKLFHFPKGKFGTIEIHLRMGRAVYKFEHTTFRSDVYKEGGHHRPVAVEFTADIALDSIRRDFTANSLYAHTRTGSVVDPTGRGVDDIRAHLLRACMKNPRDTMDDDALRILRMVRIASELNFDIEERTFEAARASCRFLVNIAFERVREEFVKILTADAKYGKKGAPRHGLALLDSLHALEYILPTLSRCKNVALPAGVYDCDLYEHLVKTMEGCPPIAEVRLAALLHDTGRAVFGPNDVVAPGHERISARDAQIELARLKFGKGAAERVCFYIDSHMYDCDGRKTPSQIRRKIFATGLEQFKNMAELRRADTLASGVVKGKPNVYRKWRREIARLIDNGAPMTLTDLKINGDVITKRLNIKKSRLIGEILNGLLIVCLEHPEYNNEETLVAQARKIASRRERRRRQK